MNFTQKSAALFAFIFVFIARIGFACEFCTIPQLGKRDGIHVETQDEKIFMKYIFEAHDFDVLDAHQAHGLHHDGHHFHDKVREYVHHLGLGWRAGEDLTLVADLPYVIRESLEIDDHDILGSEQTSEGVGDMTAAALYRFWQKDQRSASAIGGVKFPTGETHDNNSVGTRFEAELQPGTGSFDYFWGAALKQTSDRHELNTNLIYILKRQGAQDYTFGDVLSVSGLWETPVYRNDDAVLKLGIDANLQYEQKHKNRGARVDDSGGVTLFMGPSMSVALSQHASLFASLHLPAYQNLGGVHQETDYTWNAGGKIAF
jgi:hypothetical protein